ncbi:MAG: glycoside hydrolase family 5 protein [Gammaproteobacteria bacterium]
MKLKIAFTFLIAALCGVVPVAHADRFETKRCINMGNALDAPTEGEWGHVIEERSFQRIAEAGFDTVRIPVRWSAYTSGAPDYVISEPFFERVTEVINQALANQLQVVLNIHHFDELNKDPEANRDKLVALWSQIATRYRDLPASVYFEVINEPNASLKGDVMRSIVTDAFHKIRETNPTRILIMGGENWSGLKTLRTIPVIEDANQVYTFHYYDPFAFTHQKAGWTPLKDSEVVRWGSAADVAALESAAEYARLAEEELGVPVFLGEIGAYQKAPYDDVVEYTRQTREAFEAVGISWCVWSFTRTFPFFDSDKQQWDREKLAALGLSPDGPVPASSVATTVRKSVAAEEPEIGQTLENAFNALRRHVGQDGELMMSPFPEQLTSYGRIKIKRKKDDTVPGGEAIVIKVGRAGENPWDAGLSGPLSVALKKGERVVLAYWAKAEKGESAVISNAGLQMIAEPYTPLSPLEPASLTNRWQRFIVEAVVDRDYLPGEAGYTFQLAGAKQTIRMGPVFVMNVGAPR